MREHGIVLHLTIAYSNVDGGRVTDQMRYNYFVHRVPQTKFALSHTSRLPPHVLRRGSDPSTSSAAALSAALLNYTRTLTHLSGINILVTQQMSRVSFSASALLAQLAAGMALLAFAATTVDFVAFNCMSARRYYYYYKACCSPAVQHLCSCAAFCAAGVSTDRVWCGAVCCMRCVCSTH
jgi:hypothetical protein